jgi:hypothetical protein
MNHLPESTPAMIMQHAGFSSSFLSEWAAAQFG